jgi:hypothetical protein
MTESNLIKAEDNESEIAIELFNLLVEQEQALMDSRDPHRSAGEKEALYQKSEKLRKKFEQLADQTEGKVQRRRSSKGEAYCLAAYYLQQYPGGSVTVHDESTPSLIQFARKHEDQTIDSLSGPLEIGECNLERFALALKGGALKKFSLEAITKAFHRAKGELTEKVTV